MTLKSFPGYILDSVGCRKFTLGTLHRGVGVSLLLFLMVLKSIFPGSGARLSLVLFLKGVSSSQHG